VREHRRPKMSQDDPLAIQSFTHDEQGLEIELERALVLDEEAHALWVQSGSRMGQRAALFTLLSLPSSSWTFAARVVLSRIGGVALQIGTPAA